MLTLVYGPSVLPMVTIVACRHAAMLIPLFDDWASVSVVSGWRGIGPRKTWQRNVSWTDRMSAGWKAAGVIPHISTFSRSPRAWTMPVRLCSEVHNRPLM